MKPELWKEEQMCLSADDMRAAFFHFRMEPEIWCLFALDVLRKFSLPGEQDAAIYPARPDLAMRWNSAASIMQHVMCQCARMNRLKETASLRASALVRGGHPGAAASGRMINPMTLYIWTTGIR